MPNELVRITLLEPFATADGVVRLTYGHGPARSFVTSGEAIAGMAADELVDGGAHASIMPRAAVVLQPGRPEVEAVLTWDDKDRRSAMVPFDAAIVWFGDPRIPKTAPAGTPGWATFGQEKARVAFRWGWYKMPRTNSEGKTASRTGTPDTTKIGPPRIPRVKIEMLNGAGVPVGKPFEPWAHFRWDEDVDATYAGDPSSAQSAGLPTDLARFSTDDLKAFLAFREAQAKTAVK